MVERRLAAILAADVVGYSRLMESDEAGTLSLLKSYRENLIDPKIAEHSGRIVKLMGDGTLVEFASVVDAVACAVAIQEGMATQSMVLPEEQRIVLRIGVHLGDVMVDGEDLYGDGVNVAARLEGLAEAGEICLSQQALDQVETKLDLAYEDLGEQQVKNIARPVHTYRVRLDTPPATAVRPGRGRPAIALVSAMLLGASLIVAALLWFWPSSNQIVGRLSIAVLPFENLDRSDATGRLSDGIARDTITDLARYRDLDVIARNSTAIYKDKAIDAQTVGEDLGVRYVLEGSIQRAPERVRVTAQLIDAESGAHLWSERWDRPANDVFAIQTEVAERVTSALGGKNVLFSESRAAAKRKRPSDLEAYDLWVLAADALLQTSEADLRQGIAYADEAIARDPGLVRAYTEKGWLLLNLTKYTKIYRETHLEMEHLARKAIEIDPYDAEAHVLLAFAAGMLGNNAESLRANNRALELNPSSADILNIAADSMAYHGKPEKGAEMCDRAFRLNPHHPNWYYLDCPGGYFFTGRYQDVIDIMNSYDAIGDLWSGGLIWKAASQAEIGGKEAAAATVAELEHRYPELSIESLLSTQWHFDRDQERHKLLASARKAGIRICATEAEISQLDSPLQLEECVVTRQAD